MLSDVFIRRPVLATVCSLIVILAGAIAIPTLPIARYPDLTPPAVTVNAFYTGANAQAVESAVTTPLEQVINGVEGMRYITSSSTNSGASTHHGDVRHRPRPGSGGGRRAEPRQPGAGPDAGRGADQRHLGHQAVGGVHGRPGLLLRGQPLQHGVHQQLPRRLRPRRDQARARRRQRDHLRRAQVRHAPVARPAEAGGARPVGRRRDQRAARAERAGGGRRGRRRAGRRRPDVPRSASAPPAGSPRWTSSSAWS